MGLSSAAVSDDDRDDLPPEPPPRPLRQINPLGLRVVVRILPGETRSAGGLFLPEGVKEKHAEALYGEVVEVARANVTQLDEGDNVSGVPQGTMGLLPKEAGVQVPWDPELRIVDTKDVLATVEEIDPEHVH